MGSNGNGTCGEYKLTDRSDKGSDKDDKDDKKHKLLEGLLAVAVDRMDQVVRVEMEMEIRAPFLNFPMVRHPSGPHS